MSDKDFLSWVYDRLCNKHEENPNLDYMRKMKAIIDKMDDIENTPVTFKPFGAR